MKDKFVSVFFNTVSLVVWAVTIGVLVLAVVLLCTGMEKPPVFTLNAAALRPADAAVLAENGKTGEDWYAIELDMRVAASDHSPFTYTAESFAFGSASGEQADAFWVLDAPLEFSKAAPDDYLLTFYIQYPDGAEALAAAARDFCFQLRGYTGHFTFLRFPFKGSLPGFFLSDFNVPITLHEA